MPCVKTYAMCRSNKQLKKQAKRLAKEQQRARSAEESAREKKAEAMHEREVATMLQQACCACWLFCMMYTDAHGDLHVIREPIQAAAFAIARMHNAT